MLKQKLQSDADSRLNFAGPSQGPGLRLVAGVLRLGSRLMGSHGRANGMEASELRRRLPTVRGRRRLKGLVGRRGDSGHGRRSRCHRGPLQELNFHAAAHHDIMILIYGIGVACCYSTGWFRFRIQCRGCWPGSDGQKNH